MELLISDITRIVPPMCLGVKCVHKTRVVSSVTLALQLLISRELSVDKVRRVGFVDKRVARKFPVMLRRVSRVVVERYDVDSPHVVVGSLLRGVDGRVKNFIADRMSTVLSNPLGYIEDVVKSNPSAFRSGWKVISNPAETLDTILVPVDYLWYSVQYFTSVIAMFKPQIVFCGENECYPLPFGMYPTRSLTGLAYDVGNIDGINMLERKYGGANLAVVLSKIDIRDVAVSVVPRKYRSMVTFFLHVDKPRDVALRLANMQIDAMKVEDELLRMVTGGESSSDEAVFDMSLLDESIREILDEELNFS